MEDLNEQLSYTRVEYEGGGFRCVPLELYDVLKEFLFSEGGYGSDWIEIEDMEGSKCLFHRERVISVNTSTPLTRDKIAKHSAIISEEDRRFHLRHAR
jgi:hypothetical protein